MNVEKVEYPDVTYTGKWWTHPPMRNALLAGIITIATFSLSHFGVISQRLEIPFYIIAIVLGGFHWMTEGLKELVKEKEIGIEMLMIGATIGSAVLGMWDEAAFLVFLYGTAEGLEEYAFAKTRHSIRQLLDLAPKEARVIRNGKELTVPAENLEVGDIFVVRPGEAIPTDGIVIEGRSSIDESAVTGESIPREKKPSDKVFAATINQEGALKAKVAAAFNDNSLSKMIHLVEEAQEQKGKAQLFIERFGKKYSPLVFITGFLMVLIPALLGIPVSYWATRAVVLLVAAAPCALVMSTPVAIAAGIGSAGKSGILIKGGIHLENLGKIRAVAFDKTGTLTKGRPVVTDIMPLTRTTQELLQLAASVEKNSEHPLAMAILAKASDEGIDPKEAYEFRAMAGYGARAMIANETVYVGKPGLFRKLGVSFDGISAIEHLKNQGKTIILVGSKEEIYGAVAIRDEVKKEAKDVVGKLHADGIDTFMLTGDNEKTARAIAKEIGINTVLAELRPEDKISTIVELERRFGAIAMVGDGINDAPALARATVGIAMGTAGTDVAIEAADIALMGDNLKRVVDAITIGKRAKRIIRQNIAFSLVVLTLLIPGALIGLMTVTAAVFFHEASELLAIANGLRLARG
ncbi:MAG: cadmium-translocating P-type ATPase [Deltaproteobacteria bacterium]|nr:cadmium-translocating P-type ATPase [Deltaproteobacteria bacterium]HDM09660.1 cadmium-translocating P-type ATPase [Desulfobacteraceae bacterium]